MPVNRTCGGSVLWGPLSYLLRVTSWLLSQGNENHVQLFVYACSRLGVSNDMCWLAMLHVAKVLVLLALLHYYWYLYYDHCPHC